MAVAAQHRDVSSLRHRSSERCASKKLDRSPAPWLHAFTRETWFLLWEAYSLFVVAFRTAASKLKTGDRAAPFPRNAWHLFRTYSRAPIPSVIIAAPTRPPRFAQPPILERVPAITLDGQADGNFPATDSSASAAHFTGPAPTARCRTADTQPTADAPEAFAGAVLAPIKSQQKG
jgi:hypothetical protein